MGNSGLSRGVFQIPTAITPDSLWIPFTATGGLVVSASSFKLRGDRTATFTSGCRIRWQEATGTYKYGQVMSALTSGGDTTVSLIPNADYSMSINPLTIDYSYAATPPGWPIWFNWTPTITGFSSNPTNGVYRYAPFGTLIFITIREATNGTSNNASHTHSLPIQASAANGNDVWRVVGASTNSGTTAGAIGQIVSGGTTMADGVSFTSTVFTASGNSKMDLAQGFYDSV